MSRTPRVLGVLIVLLACSVTAEAADLTWTGATSSSWSDPTNWSPQRLPLQSDRLFFPASAVRKTVNNDAPPFMSVGEMEFQDAFTLNGNPLTLSGNLTFSSFFSSVGQLICNLDVVVTGFVHVGPGGATTFNGTVAFPSGGFLILETPMRRINGPITGKGFISIPENGMAVIRSTSGDYSGTISGPVDFVGSLSNAAIGSYRTVSGSGTVDLLNTNTTSRLSPGSKGDAPTPANPHVLGTFHTRVLIIEDVYEVDVKPGVGSDQVQATLLAALGSTSSLDVSVLGVPAPGDSFTIIDNTGANPVQGTFNGVPEGASVTAGGSTFRISYTGGNGNDVVLTSVVATSTSLAASSAASQFGEAVTLTATATSSNGTPTGTVTFTAGGAPIGTAPLQNGAASLAVSNLEVGTHGLGAALIGSGAFASSPAPPVSHLVTRGLTAIAVVSNSSNSVYGQPIRFTATVTPQLPSAGAPTGTVNVFADGAATGSAALAGGMATVTISALPIGSKTITASYGGDVHFEGCTSPAVTQNVAKAPTSVEARPRNPLFVGAAPLITVFVTATGGSTALPAGGVSVSEGGSLLGSQSLAGGSASMTLAPLPPGDHVLVVSYEGNAGFEASSVTVIQRVLTPAVSAGGTTVVEGNSGTTAVSLVVHLSTPVSVPVRVSFSTFAGSATEAVDYEKASGAIEFAPGEQTRAVELHVVGDIAFENDEMFSVLFFDAMNSAIDTPSVAVVIANDDRPQARRRPVAH